MIGLRATRPHADQRVPHGVGRAALEPRLPVVVLDRGPADDPRAAELTTLRDGSQVLIRALDHTDGAALVEGFARLSPHSRRSRFLGPKDQLSAAEARFFTDVDHHDHEALVAIDAVDGRAVGTARYIRDLVDPRGADVAVTVVDEWHRRGVATALIVALVVRAQAEKVDYFTAHLAEDNLAIIRLLQRADAWVELVDHASGVLVYRASPFGAAERHQDQLAREWDWTSSSLG
jgi:RimJ/RimL family protein N-acetyltransferase